MCMYMYVSECLCICVCTHIYQYASYMYSWNGEDKHYEGQFSVIRNKQGNNIDNKLQSSELETDQFTGQESSRL